MTAATPSDPVAPDASPPADRSLWKARFGLLGVLGLIAGAIAAVWYFQDRPDPEQAFQQALQALREHDLVRVQQQMDLLSGQREYAPHLQFLKGASLLEEGKVEEALVELQQVEPVPELWTLTQLLVGECYYRRGDLRMAEQIFLRIEQKFPDNPGAVRWLAAVYYDLGAMHFAIPRLEKLGRLQPDDYTSRQLLGIIRFDFEQYPEAIIAYREALSCSPPPGLVSEMRLELAKALVRHKRYEEALQELGRLPETGETLALAADCYWAIGRREQARATWSKASQMEPHDRTVLQVGGRLHLQWNEPRQAVKLMEETLEQEPHNSEVRYNLALAWRQLGNPDKATEELQKRDASQKLLLNLADLNAKAVTDPYNAELREEIASICEQLGKTDLARMWKAAAQLCRKYHASPAADQ